MLILCPFCFIAVKRGTVIRVAFAAIPPLATVLVRARGHSWTRGRSADRTTCLNLGELRFATLPALLLSGPPLATGAFVTPSLSFSVCDMRARHAHVS